MRKFLGTLALIAIVLAFVGSARNWFSVKRTREGDDTQLQIKFDRTRIHSDAKNAAQIARELGQNLEKRIDQRLDTPTDTNQDTKTQPQ